MYSGYQEEQDNARKNVLGGVLGLGLLAAAPLGAHAILKNRMAKKGKLSNVPNARGGQSGVRTGKKEINKFMSDIEAGSLGADYTPTSGPISGPNKGKTWGMNKDYYKASQEGVKLLTDPKTGEMYSPGGTRSPVDPMKRNPRFLEAPAGSVGPNVQFRDLPPASALKAPATTEGIGTEKAARIARNRQKDVARVADMVSNAIDTDIEEGYSVPANISKLANRASTGTINEQDVNTFRSWMQGAYKDDPTLVREMNEELSLVFPQQQSAQTAKLSPREQEFYNSLKTDESRSRYLKEVKNRAEGRFEPPTFPQQQSAQPKSSGSGPKLERAKQDKQGALTAVDQYKQMTGANPYTEAPRKGLLKEQEAGRQRIANLGNVVLADLQNEAFVEREANKIIGNLQAEGTAVIDGRRYKLTQLPSEATTDLRQSQTRAAAQDAMNAAENQQDKNTLRKLRRDEDLDLNRTNIDYVQEFMTDRRIELANKGVTGVRAERILASDRNVKNAIELYAQTGDPNVFQLTRKDAPSMPMTVKPQDSSFVTELSAVGQPEVSTGLFMKKDKRGAFTAPIEDKEIDLVNRRGEIEERQIELRGRIQQIDDDENMFMAAAETKPRKGLSGMNKDDFIASKLRRQREGLEEEKLQNAEALFDVNNELDAVRRDLVAEKEFGGRPEPKTFTGEPKRLFFEADEEGKPVAGTFEVRSDREMQDTANRGGGGRNEANFSAGSREDDLTREAVFVETSDGRSVPSVRRTRRSDDVGNLATDYDGDKTQTGSTVTRYGIEPGDNVKVDETVKPSRVASGTTSPYQNLDDETLNMISLMGKGADAELATKESLRRPRDKSGESLKVSEGLRRARIEGRDPQSVLRRFGVIQ